MATNTPTPIPNGESRDSARLRNIITAFMCLIIIFIMLVVQDLYERGHRPVQIVTKIDTVLVARPVTLVINDKRYTVDLAADDDDPGQDKLNPVVDNGDIARSGFRMVTKFKRVKYDTTTSK